MTIFFDRHPLHEPFPTLRSHFHKIGNESDQKVLNEYIEVINYHLDFAYQAKSICSGYIDQKVRIIHIPKEMPLPWQRAEIYLDLGDLNEIIRYGDIAVRESLSAYEAALLLTNSATKTGINPAELNWGRIREKPGLKAKLEELPNNSGNKLSSVIQEMKNSLGYSLLSEYRNWVTHRGAPRVRCNFDRFAQIPYPTGIGKEEGPAGPARLKLKIQDYIREVISAAIFIHCIPFSTKAEKIMDEQKSDLSIAHLPSDVPPPPFLFSQEPLVERYMGTYNLQENKEAFKEYPKEINLGTEEFAGHSLSIYSYYQYTSAIFGVVNFSRKLMIPTANQPTKWDEALTELFLIRWGL